MKTAAFCDRCERPFWQVPTLKMQQLTTTEKGAKVMDLYGAIVFDLCEACSVDLRDWIKEGRPDE